VFGHDAEVFRLERWIEADYNQLKAIERLFFSFGHGPRACICKNISILEMSKAVPPAAASLRLIDGWRGGRRVEDPQLLVCEADRV
jgi:cytochrome P450